MPKESRRRTHTAHHLQSVPLAKRQFSQAGAVEHISIGSQAEISGNAILSSINEPSISAPITKKEKQRSKREALLEKLEQTKSPYSKSHARRLKRKAREQLATGMNDIQDALRAVEDDVSDAAIGSETAVTQDEETLQVKRAKPKPGQIGEGKGAPLSKSQRKKALMNERVRQPLILSQLTTSGGIENPFAAIRQHAQNTLVKKEPTPQ